MKIGRDDIMDLVLLLYFYYLLGINSNRDDHGCYYNNGEKCEKQVYFTEGIGLHDGTGRSIDIR